MNRYVLLLGTLLLCGALLGLQEHWLAKVVGGTAVGAAAVCGLRAMGPNLPSPPNMFSSLLQHSGYEAGKRTPTDEVATFVIGSILAGLAFFAFV